MTMNTAIQESKSRRSFLKSAGVAGLTMMASTRAVGAEETKELLPQVNLGPHRISRLVIGSNMMLGYSHLANIVDKMMKEYFTEDRLIAFLFHCQEVGITTFQSSFDDKIDSALRRFRREGGKLQWICLATTNEYENSQRFNHLLSTHQPIAIVHHGGQTDNYFRNKEMKVVLDRLKQTRDAGVLVGLSMHNPAVMAYVEEKNWDIDFYMTCFHRLTRTEEELKTTYNCSPTGEFFINDDPPKMCETIRSTKKPCLAFKILAAGRYGDSKEVIGSRFEFAFKNIKPTDAVIVGMCPIFEDQAAINAGFTKKYGTI